MYSKISKYTGPELNAFRELCNFTVDERLFFDLRAEGWDLIGVKYQMSERGRLWSESKISTLSRDVKNKMRRIEREFTDRFPADTQ